MFFKRSFQKELMDDFSISDERIDTALRELHVINKLLGGNTISKSGINHFRNSSKTNLKIIDVGAGASDILFDLKEMNDGLNIFSVDLNRYVCHYQKTKKGGDKIICADALNIPVKDNSFDVIHSSLFLHHLKEDDIVSLLKNCTSVVKKGIIINDLRRNILAWLGIKILTFLFSKSEFVKYDGPLSVKRAFTKKDLKIILQKAGIKNYIIKRKWAFRFLLIIPSANNV